MRVTSFMTVVVLVGLLTLLWVVPTWVEVSLAGRIVGTLVGVLFIVRFGQIATRVTNPDRK